jgi:DNA-binding response OmpR family regulator
MRVLVVEDEKHLASIIKRGLQEQGYAVDVAYDGDEGQYYAENTPYDLILLDVMLPKKDGLQVCRELRNKSIAAPIMMLTAKDKVQDRVQGLDCGADDYLGKPFAFQELLARIRALLRREMNVKTPLIQVGDLTLDPAARQLKRGDKDITLTGKEYALLDFFMHHPDMLLTRTMLEQHAWDYEFDGESNLIDVYIRRLRGKIDVKGKQSLIETTRGAGYRLRSK